MPEGKVIKITDDLYSGRNTIGELLINWEHIFQRFQQNNLCLSATKTVFCPVTTTILGLASRRIQESPYHGQLRQYSHGMVPPNTSKPVSHSILHCSHN